MTALNNESQRYFFMFGNVYSSSIITESITASFFIVAWRIFYALKIFSLIIGQRELVFFPLFYILAYWIPRILYIEFFLVSFQPLHYYIYDTCGLSSDYIYFYKCLRSSFLDHLRYFKSYFFSSSSWTVGTSYVQVVWCTGAFWIFMQFRTLLLLCEGFE